MYLLVASVKATGEPLNFEFSNKVEGVKSSLENFTKMSLISNLSRAATGLVAIGTSNLSGVSFQIFFLNFRQFNFSST